MSAANCHLAGRMPHNAVWTAYSSGAQSCSREAVDKQLHYIASTFERLVCEFTATLEEQCHIASSRTSHSAGKRKPRASKLDNTDLIFASEDPILSAVYETQPGAAARVRVPALSINLTDAEKQAFRGDWIARAMSPADVEEGIKVLMVHGRSVELEHLVDRGVNMRLHSLGGYSNFFTGGLHHILQDNVTQYIALNQMLLHGWAPAACQNWQDHLRDDVAAGNVSVKAAEHFWETRSVNHLPAKLRLRSVIARVLVDLRNVHDYRLNREGTVHGAFSTAVSLSLSHVVAAKGSLYECRGKLNAGIATLDDVRAFCKDVLFPQLVLGAYLYRYSDQRHGATSVATGGEVATGTAEAWMQFRTEHWNVAESVKDCLLYVFGMRDHS